MNETDVFEQIAVQQGWTEATQIAVLLQYIKNQQSPEAFRDFLEQQADEENKYRG